MALTVAQWKAALLKEVGATLDGNSDMERSALDALTSQADILWEMDNERDYQGGGLKWHYLWSKRRYLNYLRGRLRIYTNAALGNLNPQLGTTFDHVGEMLKECEREIQEVGTTLAQSRASVIAELTATSAYDPPGACDPSNPGYAGHPVIRTIPGGLR